MHFPRIKGCFIVEVSCRVPTHGCEILYRVLIGFPGERFRFAGDESGGAASDSAVLAAESLPLLPGSYEELVDLWIPPASAALLGALREVVKRRLSVKGK